MAKKVAENSVVAQALKVVAAKNMGVTLDSLNTVTSIDFTQVTVPQGTIIQIPAVEEINDFLYNDKSTLNGTVYDNYGIVCPVVDNTGNIISTKRISINSLQREMPVYAMVDGIPQATAELKGGDTELARTLRSMEVVGDKVRHICGKKLKAVREEIVPSPRYQNGVVVGIRDRKIPVWDEFQG
jgi:hypothetical protein